MTLIPLAAEEQTRHLPVPPIFFGLTMFLLFTILMIGLLMFGKGRPHS